MHFLITAGIFLLAGGAAPETAYYRVELAPSGSLVSIGAPVVRGATVLFHGYPDGKLMSLRKSDVRNVSRITAQEAAAPAQKSTVAIGNLAMQGGGAPAASPSARSSPANAPAQAPHIVPTRDGLAITSSPDLPK